MLKIYNSIAREKQRFEPIHPGKVHLYVCGMTVYDYCHLGHARVLVVFDMVQRWFKSLGYKVTYVRNITDIDDKIIKRAAENSESVSQLTERFIAAMREDAARLGVEAPTHEPLATQHIPRMLQLIQTLLDKKLAYQAANGDIYYSVHQFKSYGKLSGKSLDDLRAGERVEIDQAKKDPLDFVLWKSAKPSEPFWEAPWGKGRPGWHIECSAMSEQYLGHHFDIHGGGQDLQFPHHENEIAQSEGAHDETYVNYWMHNGFVRVDNEKMSKSLGNFFTVREVLKKYQPEVIRFFILRAHYRSPLNYSDQHLDDAKQSLNRLYTALRGLQVAAGTPDGQSDYEKRFRDAMNDDFNTPEAVAVLFDLANEINKSKSPEQATLLKSLANSLGLLQQDSEAYFQGINVIDVPAGELTLTGYPPTVSVTNYNPEIIDQRITARNAARKSKNFAEADRIRDELLQAGVVLEDTASGTIWRRG